MNWLDLLAVLGEKAILPPEGILQGVKMREELEILSTWTALMLVAMIETQLCWLQQKSIYGLMCLTRP